MFGIDEMKTLSGGGRGVILMALDPKETLRQALAIDARGVVMIGTGRGGKAREEKLAGAALEAACRQAGAQGPCAGVDDQGDGIAAGVRRLSNQSVDKPPQWCNVDLRRVLYVKHLNWRGSGRVEWPNASGTQARRAMRAWLVIEWLIAALATVIHLQLGKQYEQSD